MESSFVSTAFAHDRNAFLCFTPCGRDMLGNRMFSRLAAALLLVGWCTAQDATNSPAQTPPATPSQADATAGSVPPLKQVVVVTGTYDPMPLEESDRDVDVIQVNQSRLLFDSFADYLKLDSSVDLQERAPGGIQSDLSIRGGTLDRKS